MLNPKKIKEEDMKQKRLHIPMKLIFFSFIVLLMLDSRSATAQAANGWQNEVTLYGWYAGIGGTVQAPSGAASDFSVDASDILDDLEFMLMADYVGRYERWSVIVDFVYMDVGDSANIPTRAGSANVDLNVSSYLVNGGFGFDVWRGDNGVLSVVGGVRYLSLDVDYDASVQGMMLLSSSRSDSLTDGFVGLRGQVRFNDKWFLPYYADIGTGGSDVSYQLYAAIGYRFGWGDIRFGYRYIGIEMDDDMIMDDLQLSGPVLGVGFRF